jgi:hypothetical protein
VFQVHIYTLFRYEELEAVEISKKLSSLDSTVKEDRTLSDVKVVDVTSAEQSKNDVAEPENESVSSVVANGKKFYG